MADKRFNLSDGEHQDAIDALTAHDLALMLATDLGLVDEVTRERAQEALLRIYRGEASIEGTNINIPLSPGEGPERCG